MFSSHRLWVVAAAEVPAAVPAAAVAEVVAAADIVASADVDVADVVANAVSADVDAMVDGK